MGTLDIIGHVGYLFVFGGTVALARKRKIGWIMRIIGAAIWLSLGIVMGMSSLWFWESAFIVADIYGFSRWKQPSK
jgi:hypothetical protein